MLKPGVLTLYGLDILYAKACVLKTWFFPNQACLWGSYFLFKESVGVGWGMFPRCRRLVPPALAARFPPNTILAPEKHFGACFGGHKKPLREWGHALPSFSSQKHSFQPQKNAGAYFGGHKKPLREWGHQNLCFYLQKKPWGVFWGYEKPLREWPHALPGCGQVLVSNPGLEPGASGVLRPCASRLI